MIKERRKHPRLRIPLEAEYLVAGEAEWRQGTIWTLGAGGAALLCEERLGKGTPLEGLHFVVEAEGDLPETRIEVGAEVVSIDRRGDFGRSSNFMLGLRFMDLGEQEFELLRQFVFRRLTGGPQQADDAAAEPDEKSAAPPIEIRFKLFDEFVEEVSENLSPSGMFIRAHRPLPPGSQFTFQFQLGEDFSLFQGTAEVVWTRRRGEGPDRPPGMGVRFLTLDLTSQKMVRRLVGQRGTADPPEGAVAADRPRPAAASHSPVKISEEGEPFAMEPEPEPEPAVPAAESAESNASEERPSRRTKRLEKRLGEAESRRLGAEAEAAELREALQAVEPQGDLEKKLQQARKELQHRQAQWERKEVDLEEELARRSASEVELQERVEQAGETEAELLQRLEQAEGSRKELEHLLAESAETENELERVRLELDEAKDEWAAAEAKLRSQLEQKTTSESELRKSAELAGEAEAELRQRLEQLEGECSRLEERLEQAEGSESELERVQREAQRTSQELEATEAELRARLEQSSATETELRAQLEKRSASEADLEKRLVEAVSGNTELSRRVDELGKSRSELERDLERSAEAESELREQARELRAEGAGLVKRLSRAATEMGGIRRLTEEMKSRLNGDLSADRAMEADLASTLAELAEARSGLDEKVEALAAAHGSLGERLARITEAWSSLESGVAEITLEAVYNDEPPAPRSSERKELQPAAQVEVEAESADAEPDEPAAAPMPPAIEPEAAPERQAAAELERTGEEAPSGPEIEDCATEAPAEGPEPVATGAARLVDVARRAVARLGFGRTLATDGNGGGPEPDPRLVPAEEIESVAPGNGGSPVAIEDTVKAWAAAWSEQRVEDYLSFYSREFTSSQPDEDDGSGEAPHAWLPPIAGMELTLGPISQNEVAPGRIAVQFEQSVETDSYKRRTGRTLEMVRESDAWKIAAESFQEIPN